MSAVAYFAHMQGSRVLEQSIAVFGESGSGKTVLLSSFYGAAQEPQHRKKRLFHVLANDPGQGARLHQNYLGMRNAARLPVAGKLSATSYSFSVKMKDGADPKAIKDKPFDALRLVWHDYPGEWFEEDVSGPAEAQHRLDTFRSLLGSDVALLLVDGQRLLENAGEEERYLKSLLANLRNGLLLLKDDLLEDGKPLAQFPRIWMLALSKSDLLPDMDVDHFKELLIEKVGADIGELREVLAGLVDGSDALSVGEDFVLLSSAKFDAGKIEVAERVGVDLILPLVAMLPFERHLRWVHAKLVPAKVAERFVGGAGVLATVLVGGKFGGKVLGKVRMGGPVGVVLKLAGMALSKEVLEDATKLVGDKLRDLNSESLAKRDYLTATLTGFQMDLEKGEDERVLLTSVR